MKSPGNSDPIPSLVQTWLSRTPQPPRKARSLYQLQVETLEDRVVPTTWTVTNTLASGTGSLFQAVQNANSDTSPSMINFSPTVFATPQTITLTSSLTLTNTTEPVSIQGPTGVAVTVSGNNTVQDFVITTSGVVATIQNLTIANGNGTNGGGVSVTAGTVTVNHCIITNNTAGYGGGLVAYNSAVVLVEDCTLTGNTAASDGGAIDFAGSSPALTVIGCTLTNNTCTTTGTGGGGAIRSTATSPFTVIDSTISGNVCHSIYYGGGGILLLNGDLTLVGCTVTGNNAISVGGDGGGGGIYNSYPSSNLVLLNDIVWNNTATNNNFNDICSVYNSPQLSASYTLIGNTSGADINNNGPGNILGVPTTPAILGSLANNGGPTQTFAPVANSAPVGAGGSVTAANAAITSTTATTLAVANGHVFAASSLTPQLSFVNQPSNATAGAPLNPVTVQVNLPVDFDEYIRIDNEIMEVVGLTIDSNGTATLNVERGADGTTAATHAVNAPVFLVSDQRGRVIPDQGTATPVDIGAVQSTAVIPSAGVGLALTMGISSGQLNGTTTVLTNSAGQAVFSNLSVPATGTYQLTLGGITTSNSFTVTAPVYPIVSSVSPGYGVAGSTVAITGTNFTGATGVSFGTTAATSFTVNSATSITATAPAGTGVVDVTVTTSNVTSATSTSDQFNYAPVVTAISPNNGSTTGGASVTITGTNFSSVTAVKFGANNGTTYTVNSATSITATAPAGGGVVDVTVVNAGGTSPTSSADQFTYSTGTATWTVTNTLASGSGSLYWAVQSANADALNPSLINFSPTVFATPQTITLTTSLTLSNVNQPVTIQGPTGVAVTVSGNNLIQDFSVNTPGVVATIQYLTVSNANGGGVDILDGNVTIDHCTISNNTSYNGGGVLVTGSAVALIENSTITGNTASHNGGGVELAGNTAFVTLIDSTLSGNTVLSGGGGGGGFFFDNVGTLPAGVATIIDCTIANNVAYAGTEYQNGGIGGNSANVNVIGSTITGNTGAGVGLGSVYSLTLLDDIIWNNTFDLGNGTYSTPSINYTLVGNTTGASLPANSVGNIYNVSTTPAILGSLGNHGGPTATYVPVANSAPVGQGGNVTTVYTADTSATASTLSVASGYVFASTSLTPELSFVTQPTSATAGTPLNPVTVQVTNPVDFDEYIQVDSEIMEVVGLTINSNGTATLDVDRGVDGTTAAPHAANAPIYLVSDQRGEVVANQGTPPTVDMGSVQSTASIPTAGLGLALTMSISSGTLNGTTTALTNTAGQAVFNNLSVPTAGTYQLLVAGVSSISFTVNNPPPAITSVVINQQMTSLYNAAGQPTAGVQRSMVDDVVYTFSEAVNITSSSIEPNVFTIAYAPGFTGTGLPTLNWTPVTGSNNTQWAVTFTGPNTEGGSILNGEYVITVNDPTAITAQLDSQALSLAVSGIGGASQSFYRLFGDINGDEAVNNADNARFKQAMSAYNPAFDFNDDGAVNNADDAQFKNSLSLSFTGFTPTI